jgi:hypothetical protein
MNTGADDDSLSTPTLAFNNSSQRPSDDAATAAVIASRPASANRKYPGRTLRARYRCIIKFPPPSIILESDLD